MPGPARTRYAVCFTIGRYDETPGPRVFRCKKAANAFLNGPDQDRGWRDPVPVVCSASYSGPKCDRTFRDFLPAESMAGVVPTPRVRDEIERLLTDRTGDYTCYLDKSWRFDEIDSDAWRRPGHEYSGRRHSGIGEIVVKAVYDLERAFERLHPDAPLPKAADFWCSWQVQQHLAVFCADVAESETALGHARDRRDAKKLAGFSRVQINRQLAAYAHELLSDAVGSNLTASPSGGSPESANGKAGRPEARRRGRPQEIPDERKKVAADLKASGASNDRAAAAIYNVKYPTTQQKKNVPAILKNYERKLRRLASSSPGKARLRPNKIKG